MRLKLTVIGIVQGVGFRPFIYRLAVGNGLKGYVKNRGDAGVEIVIEGTDHSVERFLTQLRRNRPPLAQIYDIATTQPNGREEFSQFVIEKSSEDAECSGSVIPPDIAICDDCLRELRDPKDPRYEYFFITCTNCGPRFTIIEKLPYDRDNTTMREFPMCGLCKSEYSDPLSRRFHAQTIACPECGPRAYLTTGNGKIVKCGDPIREAGKLLSRGNILAIKGYGGFHIAASTVLDEPLMKLRRVKHRSQKPFAIVARSIQAIATFAQMSKAERQLLTSYQHPIVLLSKKRRFPLSNLIAPGLHNVGVMLPYTGLHHMLFDRVEDLAFIMTSANPPNQPITKDNHEALGTLKGVVDYFLLHNRQIAYRCDDSVLRLHGKNQAFIRRSRGYAPAPVTLKEKAQHCIIGLGAELNNSSCILLENRAFISQHIGDVENLETRAFLESATKHLIRLTNSKPEAIACDLHPKFTTTQLAEQFADENKWQIVRVQHHFAHAAALMAEHGIDEMICVCCDGYGYGTDGGAWGGEVILANLNELQFERLAHLENQPLVGGDVATRYPLRTAAAMLHEESDVKPWLMKNKRHFHHGVDEIQILLDQLAKASPVSTSSCGRVMDAASAILDVCYERTYEGEPAMRLESSAINGKNVLRLKPIIEGGTLKTTELMRALFRERNRHSQADLAYSVHDYLASGLAELAIHKASENHVKTIGFSGGSASNIILASQMRAEVEKAGLKFAVHHAVPSGDGGISLGQAIFGGFSRS